VALMVRTRLVLLYEKSHTVRASEEAKMEEGNEWVSVKVSTHTR
jgi:hypothetical protein